MPVDTPPAAHTLDAPNTHTALVNVERRQRRTWGRRAFVLVRLCFACLVLVALGGVGLTVFDTLTAPDTSGSVLISLVNANLLLLLAMTLFLGRQLAVALLERRGRLRKSRLPFRFLGIFSVIAILPAVVVSAFAVVMLNQGLETWFSAKVSRALEGSLQVAQAYLDEHEKALLIETEALAQDPNLSLRAFYFDPVFLRQMLQEQQDQRGLDELSLYDTNGRLISSGAPRGTQLMTDVTTLFGALETDNFRNSRALTDLLDQRVIALVPVTNGTWLLASRGIHPFVVARMNETEAAYTEYYSLLNDRALFRLLFNLFLLLITLATLIGAIWVGVRLASKVVGPVTALVHATNKVSAGDFDIRLTPDDDDELGILTQSFNRMTQQLKNSRNLLERKNKELDTRRRTMEALLTSVSAAVIAVDEHHEILICNRSARELLNVRTGQILTERLPECAELIREFQERSENLLQRQLRLHRDGEGITVLVRMVPQLGVGRKDKSLVITFDDVTPLLSAQKVAAWSDVARRLAHEIKNPLTPIQLSAERLKRKYLRTLALEDQELFGQLTETIVRQTEQMRGLLNEFSDFARMPSPILAPVNVLDVLEEVLLLQRTGRSQIAFQTDYAVPPAQAVILADRNHLTRVFTNVIENGVNAIEERELPKGQAEKLPPGAMNLVVKISQTGTLDLSISDNGRGLPQDVAPEELFDPYVTTRKKGTGLGLAIVRRVMDDHNGQVRLLRRDGGGTTVELTFPLSATPADAAPTTTEEQSQDNKDKDTAHHDQPHTQAASVNIL